ncbi:MAG: hypothetical protein WAW86_01365 [Gammaproteobacteria bacterium]
MATSRSDERNQNIEYAAGSSHLIKSAFVASSSERASDPRMTQSQAVNRQHQYTVTITPPAVSIQDHLSALFSYREETPLMKSGFFLRASNASSSSSRSVQPGIEYQEKTEFLKAHFPSLFTNGSLITEPVIIMKDDVENKDYEEKLRQQPSDGAVAAFNKSGYLVVKHVSMKKCIEKLLALTLEQLKSNDIKKIFEDILEDTISELEPFKSDDDIVLMASGQSYLSAPLTQSLEIKLVDPNTNAALKNNKRVKDTPVKAFLSELDHLVELNDRKSQCNPAR